MTQTPQSIAATLHFGADAAPSVWDSAAPIAWALRKMQIEILAQDTALVADTIVMATCHGDVVLRNGSEQGVGRALTVEIRSSVDADPSIPRDLCRHLVRHLSGHFIPRAVFWHPTHEMLDPFQFGRMAAAAGRTRTAQPVVLH